MQDKKALNLSDSMMLKLSHKVSQITNVRLPTNKFSVGTLSPPVQASASKISDENFCKKAPIASHIVSLVTNLGLSCFPLYFELPETLPLVII